MCSKTNYKVGELEGCKIEEVHILGPFRSLHNQYFEVEEFSVERTFFPPSLHASSPTPSNDRASPSATAAAAAAAAAG